MFEVSLVSKVKIKKEKRILTIFHQLQIMEIKVTSLSLFRMLLLTRVRLVEQIKISMINHLVLAQISTYKIQEPVEWENHTNPQIHIQT